MKQRGKSAVSGIQIGTHILKSFQLSVGNPFFFKCWSLHIFQMWVTSKKYTKKKPDKDVGLQMFITLQSQRLHWQKRLEPMCNALQKCEWNSRLPPYNVQ